MRQIAIYSAILTGFLVSATYAGAETLVVEAEDGSYGPGVALEHRIEEDRLVLVVREGVDLTELATLLKERLAQIEVNIEGQLLTLSGAAPATLLSQLVLVDVTGDEESSNPLGELSALGGAIAMGEQVDEGNSIRAGKPSQVAPVVAPHAKAERLVGQITKATRGSFPEVTLEFRVRWPIQSGPLKGKWKKGVIVRAPVLTSTVLESEDMQRNLVGYYLKPGDRVWIHLLVDEKGAATIDWLERRGLKRK
ncbi:MAG: hypothetical protein HOI23_07275 [Deltaproteobacteria bacterium]|jgi:hypothetical protein|nr:hypothetical protein [Deltaproteobacteria bacterium]MBT6435035.1 hypothetical protein [Deltaproteobacteria bacterium]